jgi:heterodisulfide reductase subunit B
MLNCKEVTRRLSAAQDRELSLAERLQLKMHLAMCGGCRSFSRQMDLLRDACKRYIDKEIRHERRPD